ncbi:unnamed protein product [Calypogeia fissa]
MPADYNTMDVETLSQVEDISISEEEALDDSSLDSQIWGGLSDELVELIRAFLPPSALFRFRCVCKRWNSLCSNPVFNKLYKEITPPTSLSVFILTHDAYNKRVDSSYLESSKLFKLRLDFLPKEASVLLAESGGLMCVGSLDPDNSTLWVCNPLTRSWRRLPDCHLREVCRGGESPLVNMMVKANGAYKVVVIGDPSLTNTFSTQLKVYHSEKGIWTQHMNNLSVRSNLSSTSVIRDGVLYWCTMAPDGLHAYNLEQGAWSHRRVSFPRLFTPFGCAYLFKVGGRIALMGLKLGGKNFSVGLWTLEGEEEHASPAAVQWVVMPYRSIPLIQRHRLVNGYVQKSSVCLARSESELCFQGNSVKGNWLPGVPFHDQDSQVKHIWCPYEPRLDIRA